MCHVVIFYKKLCWHKHSRRSCMRSHQRLQQSQGSIGGPKRHPQFCRVYRWGFFSPPTSPFGSQLGIGWLGSTRVEELRAPHSLRAGPSGRPRCAQQTRSLCVSRTRWDVEDVTWGPHHRNRLKTWVVSRGFSVKRTLLSFLLIIRRVFREIIDRLLWTREDLRSVIRLLSNPAA